MSHQAPTEAQVHESLNNAKANGWFGRATVADVDDITQDLVMCDADLEGFAPEIVKPHVLSWIRDQK